MIERDPVDPRSDEQAQWDECDGCGKKAQGCVTRDCCQTDYSAGPASTERTLCPACDADYIEGYDGLRHPIGDAVSKLREALAVALDELKHLAIKPRPVDWESYFWAVGQSAHFAEQEARRIAGMEVK